MNKKASGIKKQTKRNNSPLSNSLIHTTHVSSSILLNTQPSSPSNTTRSSSQIIWKRVNSPSGKYFKETAPKDYRKSKTISQEEMIRVLHLSQIHASKILNCSLSTLKRRFYELKNDFGLKSWPQYFREVRHLPIFRRMYPMSLEFIMNQKNVDELVV